VGGAHPTRDPTDPASPPQEPKGPFRAVTARGGRATRPIDRSCPENSRRPGFRAGEAPTHFSAPGIGRMNPASGRPRSLSSIFGRSATSRRSRCTCNRAVEIRYVDCPDLPLRTGPSRDVRMSGVPIVWTSQGR
jgi:hypothetical protein